MHPQYDIIYPLIDYFCQNNFLLEPFFWGFYNGIENDLIQLIIPISQG